MLSIEEKEKKANRPIPSHSKTGASGVFSRQNHHRTAPHRKKEKLDELELERLPTVSLSNGKMQMDGILRPFPPFSEKIKKVFLA